MEFSTDFHDLVDNCLRKNPQERFSVSQLLAHPFLRNAKPPQYLSKAFQQYPELDIRPLAMTRKQDRIPKPNSVEQEQCQAVGWNFSPNSSWVGQPLPTPLDTHPIAIKNRDTMSPITPEDEIAHMVGKPEPY